VSHRKAIDEHVQLVQVTPPDCTPQLVMVTDDRTRMALPSGPGGEDNCVVGIAIDTSCNVVRALKDELHSDTISLTSLKLLYMSHYVGPTTTSYQP
jgi:hypothetical protein